MPTFPFTSKKKYDQQPVNTIIYSDIERSFFSMQKGQSSIHGS